MKNMLICILLSLFALCVHSQTVKPLSIGESISFHSAILKEDRSLNIYLPQKYDSAKTYPTLYVLDGSIDEDFLHICGLVQFFNLQFNMPDFIVVGIANVDRKRDFTFYTPLKDLQKEYPTTGHSDSFIACLEKEIQPLIIQHYKTNDTRYLIGQSLGGLLASEILLKKPNLFSHYLIVSPSLWWDNESILRHANTWIKQQDYTDISVYISVGKGEHKVMQREAKGIYTQLSESKKPIRWLHYNLMKEENHATILHRSIYEALLILFPFQES